MNHYQKSYLSPKTNVIIIEPVSVLCASGGLPVNPDPEDNIVGG